MIAPQITLMAAPSDRTLTDPMGVEVEGEEETNVAGAEGEGDDREAHPGEEEARGNEGAAGEDEEAGSEEAIVKVQRTRSDTSKESGSKASVDAANEDWNRSAVRWILSPSSCFVCFVFVCLFVLLFLFKRFF